ncbi:thioredoxin family protein [Pedobacter nyackensis]|uniref:Thioredoxin-like n=1 Tax=Pedobacter nyackensis TaxID=475255 RepID=A0A1W2CQ71_9SPHI|nr:thioredoxin family protein [Pedobacter nyackensis]SMC87407.1 Thioredoxin-like [Pedobacter nyackensis]
MKKNLIGIFLLFSTLSVFAQGIEFEHSSWSEAVKKAKAQNKLIFVDVYTSWCGPCKVMSTQVFTRPEIGATYNQGFVNVKIDAEKGEGIALAKKYEVKSYPTYLFINPADESLFDRSKSSIAAADFNDLGDRVITKFSGKKEISLAELDAKYKSADYDEAFSRAYIKRLKAEGKSTNPVLEAYITKFITNTATSDQLYFIGLNFTKGAGSKLYDYMIKNYKEIDAVLCKNDGVSAANLYSKIRDEAKSKIDEVFKSNGVISVGETELNTLFANLNAVEISERKDKKVLEYKIRLYSSNNDTVKLIEAYRAYISRFLLPADKTATIGKEGIIIDKNAPLPVLGIDSAGASGWCSNYALRLSKLSKQSQDKKLAISLCKKAITLNKSSVVKNSMNVTIYNFGDKAGAIKQQSDLIAEMKVSNDEYLTNAETTLQKMKDNESDIPVFSYKRKLQKKLQH